MAPAAPPLAGPAAIIAERVGVPVPQSRQVGQTRRLARTIDVLTSLVPEPSTSTLPSLLTGACRPLSPRPSIPFTDGLI